MKSLFTLLLAGGLLAPLGAGHAYSSPLETSPMVGRTWKTGARIWVGTRDTYGNVASETLTLRVRRESACETCWVSSVEMAKVGTGEGRGRVSGQGLAPSQALSPPRRRGWGSSRPGAAR